MFANRNSQFLFAIGALSVRAFSLRAPINHNSSFLRAAPIATPGRALDAPPTVCLLGSSRWPRSPRRASASGVARFGVPRPVGCAPSALPPMRQLAQQVFAMMAALAPAVQSPEAAQLEHRASWSLQSSAAGASGCGLRTGGVASDGDALGGAVRGGEFVARPPLLPPAGGVGAERHSLHDLRHSVLMKARLVLHSSRLAHSSHLISSSAQRAGSGRCTSLPHHPHVRWQSFAMKRRLRTQCSP